MRVAAATLMAGACSGEVFFKETFDASWTDRWTPSEKKTDFGEFKHTAGEWYGDEEAGKGLQTGQDAKFYAISAPAAKPVESNKGKTLVVSFQLKDTWRLTAAAGTSKYSPAIMTRRDST